MAMAVMHPCHASRSPCDPSVQVGFRLPRMNRLSTIMNQVFIAENKYADELRATAKAIVADGKGKNIRNICV
jgi:hypothetical protein